MKKLVQIMSLPSPSGVFVLFMKNEKFKKSKDVSRVTVPFWGFCFVHLTTMDYIHQQENLWVTVPSWGFSFVHRNILQHHRFRPNRRVTVPCRGFPFFMLVGHLTKEPEIAYTLPSPLGGFLFFILKNIFIGYSIIIQCYRPLLGFLFFS